MSAVTGLAGSTRVLRCGVIGLGRAAASMLPSLAAHPGIQMVAAAEPREAARLAFTDRYGGRAYETAEELCGDPDVDVVYIATPHQLHAEHAIRAAEGGKHVLVEKPMALTVADCAAMNAATERSGSVLVVGPTHGYDPSILEMADIIRSGRVGRARMILTFDYTNFLYRPRRPEELDTSLGGGIVFNQLPHQVDIVRLLAGGAVQSVTASVGVWDSGRPTEGSSMAFLQFDNGAAATMVYSGYDRFDSDEFHGWVGEGGRVKPADGHGRARRALRDATSAGTEADMKASTGFGGSSEKNRAGSAQGQEASHPHFGVTIVSCEGADLRVTPNGVSIYDDEGHSHVEVPRGRAVPDKGRVADELHAAVTGGAPAVHDGAWGLATLEVCLAVLESSRTQRPVSVSQTASRGAREASPAGAAV